MALDFPAAPGEGATFTAEGVTWVYTGGRWAIRTQVDTVTAPARNVIINGDFDIWQRGTSLAAATGARFLADRWMTRGDGTTVAPSRQAFTLGQTDVPGEPSYFHRAVVSSVAGTSNQAVLTQKIEGVRTLAGRTVTLSFYAKADAAKNIAVEFVQYFGTSGTSALQGIGAQLVALTATWQRVEITVAIPSLAGKTVSGGNDYVQVKFWFDAGSSFDNSSVGNAAGLGHQSGTFDVAQVQLEAGSVATPFARRHAAVEMILCQRYYEVVRIALASSSFGGSMALNRGHWATFKRATPTLAYTPDSGTGGTLVAEGTGLYYQSTVHSVVSGVTVRGDAEI